MNPDDITALHSAWCGMTGQELNYRAVERLFYDFADFGFTQDDMRCVIEGMKRHNRQSDAKYKFQIHKVVGDLELFASLLADFRSREKARPKSKTESEKVIELFRKSPAPEVDHAPKIIGDVLRKIGGQT